MFFRVELLRFRELEGFNRYLCSCSPAVSLHPELEVAKRRCRPQPSVLGAGGTCKATCRQHRESLGCDRRRAVLQPFPLCSDNCEVTFEGLLEAIFSVSRLEISEEFHPVGHKQFNPYQRDGEGNWRELISLRKSQT